MGVKRKPDRVEETAASYAAKRPAKACSTVPKSVLPDVQPADDATCKKVTDKIFAERKELLHKLAQ